MEAKDRKILDRVRKLMALANDPSASEGEVENALKAAELLIIKHNLEKSEVEMSPLDIDITLLTEKVKGEESMNWIWDLTGVVGEGHNCRCLGYKYQEKTRYGNIAEKRGVKIVGFLEDREVVKELVELTVPMVRNLVKKR